ncbi:MAG: thioredoxin-like domain-containing protein, partial [Bacteroidales bacterium]|nr:thioredoxin-like domain-containing protein [Bacteroidales bacterium]
RALYESDKNYLIEFIKKNHKSAVIYMALYQYIGISPILMIDNDLEIFEYVLGELQKYHPKLEQTSLLESEISKHKLLIKQRTNDYISLKPGMQAPDFILPDINSNNISLSTYKGTKVVICFWSSWSKTSVNSVKKLMSTIANNSDISLILISLDTKAESWKSSIQNNELDSYVNLCDFKTWESPVIKIYGIKMLPTFVIINNSGEIEIISEDFSEILNSINNTN